MTNSISYIIGTHNEPANYIHALLSQLIKHIDAEDEIIVVDDYSDNPETIRALSVYEDRINLHYHKLDGDFAAHKNYMNSLAKGTNIFNIDADENVNEILLKTLKEILANNPSVEAYRVPRINLVPDITEEDMARYGWRFHPGTKYINFPDEQTRIYKNDPKISWKGAVHEQLQGFTSHTTLPAMNELGEIDPSYCLLHVKNRERQIKQNEFYANIHS